MPAEFIRASAGSGKTYQLSGRYIGILIRGLRADCLVDPGQILAATFTRAAAGEILERVLLRLALATLDPMERGKLQASAQCENITAQECQRALSLMAENLHRVNIGTIDSFFARIARSMPEELGLSAGWRVVSEVEADQLSLEALDILLTGAQAVETVRLWTIYQRYRTRLQISRPMKKALDSVRFHRLEEASSQFHGEPPRLNEALRKELIEILQQAPTPITKDGSITKNYANARQKFLDSLIPGVRLDLLLARATDTSLLSRLFHNEPMSASKTVFFQEELRESLDPFLETLHLIQKNLFQDQQTALARLTRMYRQCYEDLSRERGWLTFRDVEESVRTGIKQDDGSAMSDLYFRLDSRLEHILFDEFQDTSWSQMDFFDPIIREFLSKGQAVIVVGDPKQAIYGWRGGDRAVIDNFPRRFDLKPPEITFLSTSFRSSPVVLQTVDRVFQNLPLYVEQLRGAPEIEQAVENWLHNYHLHTATESNQRLPGCARLLEADSNGDDPDAALIEQIIGSAQVHYSENREIAILTRRKALIPRILNELRNHHLPAAGDGGSTVTDSFAVEVILAALTWMDHPDHTVARELASHAPWGERLGLGRATPEVVRETRRDWLLQWHDDGAAPLISGWLKQMSADLSAHDLERCQQLQELASRFDLTGGGRITTFVQQSRKELVRSIQNCPIKVMTIHASKGLEFTAVILTDLDRPTTASSPGVPRVVNYPTENGVSTSLVPDATLRGGQALRQEAASQAFMEQLSVLYVGMTRARAYLDLVILAEPKKDEAEPKAKKSLASILRTTLPPHYHLGHSFADSETDPTVTLPQCDSSPTHLLDPLFSRPPLSLPSLNPGPVRRGGETRSPSKEEGQGKRLVNTLFGQRPEKALHRGTLIHAWLAQIEWLPLDPEKGLKARILTQTKSLWSSLGEVAAKKEFDHFWGKLAQPELQALFARTTYTSTWATQAIEVWRERRFITQVKGEHWSGAFDRVVLSRTPHGEVDHAEVIDFKTDWVKDASALQERKEFYSPQLKAYTEILQTTFPQAQLSARLIFINEV